MTTSRDLRRRWSGATVAPSPSPAGPRAAESPIHDSIRSSIPRRPSPETLACYQGFQEDRAFCNIVHRANAAKSTGPKTAEGKARSRANALKHGLTGDGTVLPPDQAAEVDALAAQLEREMQPSGAMGRILLRRVAAMSTRLDRCAEHEAVMTAKRVRDAAKDRDNARHAEVDAIGAGIGVDPATSVRLLKQTPEGIDWLVRMWLDVRGDLLHPRRITWESRHLTRVEHLLGRPLNEYPLTEHGPLCRAAWGDFSDLSADQGAGLTRAGRKAWARARLAELIGAEVAGLRALRAEVDGEDEAIDRAEAAERALFDPSKEGQLARKYEAAAERTLFRALREFHQVEERARAEAVAAPEPSSTAIPPAGPDSARPRVAARPAPVAAPSAMLSTPAQTNPTTVAWMPAIGGP